MPLLPMPGKPSWRIASYDTIATVFDKFRLRACSTIGTREAAFRIGFQEVFRKAFRFLPEYEHIIVLELDIGITLFRFRRQIKKRFILVFVQDFLKILSDLDIDERPVIETGLF